jgi:hypothetical protein
MTGSRSALARIVLVGAVSVAAGVSIYWVALRRSSNDADVAAPHATDAVATLAPADRATPLPATPGEQVDCPPGWQLFDNTVLHYRICYPPDWGIFTDESADPAQALSTEDFGRQIILAGPGWFPFPLNQRPEDIPAEVTLRVGEAPRVSLQFAQPELQFEGCQPTTVESISQSNALWCADTYTIGKNDRAQFGPDGESYTLKVLIPLRSPQPINGLDTTGWRLYIKAVTLSRLHPNRDDLFWQIIRSVTVY